MICQHQYPVNKGYVCYFWGGCNHLPPVDRSCIHDLDAWMYALFAMYAADYVVVQIERR